MSGPLKFIVDVPSFGKAIEDFAAVCGMSIRGAFEYQAAQLCNELIQRTPPFSGKSLARMIDARPVTEKGTKPQLRDTSLENESARNVGKLRVEKDIRKVIYGLTGSSLSARQLALKPGSVLSGGGVLEKVDGRPSVRVFAKRGQAFGTDLTHYMPGASNATLYTHHQEARTKSGRVTIAGERTRNVGRWVFLNRLVTEEERLADYIKQRQYGVGSAKGGWAAGYLKYGGRMSKRGWIGRYAGITGTTEDNLNHPESKTKPKITIINRSKWAAGNDPEGIIAASLDGRAKAIAGSIRRALEEQWGSSFRRHLAKREAAS